MEWTQNQSDVTLDLTLVNKDSGTDQTPTPTRLIRNCEEVGLFQDLQNVNPFDEVFKNAVENPTIVNLCAPTNSSSDDTLHTPQIYPVSQDEASSVIDNSSNIYTLDNSICHIDKNRNDTDNDLVIVLDSESLSKTSKLAKCKLQTVKTKTKISPVPIKKLKGHNRHKHDVQKQREANKAAQIRCRQRKQQEMQELKNEVQNLRQVNEKLLKVNAELQETVKSLENRLQGNPVTSTVSTTTKIGNKAAVSDKKPLSHRKPLNIQPKKLTSLSMKSAPLTSVFNINNLTSVPVQSNANNNTVIFIVNPVNATTTFMEKGEISEAGYRSRVP